jgi:hypothetical protein
MPEPIKSTKGGTDIGPRDPTRDAENPDYWCRRRPTKDWSRTYGSRSPTRT